MQSVKNKRTSRWRWNWCISNSNYWRRWINTSCSCISGGFGYRVPPQVRIIDDCRRGSGARGFSVLGNTALEEENFDDDADVEEYDFTLGDFNFDPDDSSLG